MSSVDDSPLSSSSSGDFAAFLDEELESTSDGSPEIDEDEHEIEQCLRIKRQKLVELDTVIESHDRASNGVSSQSIASVKDDICTHPGFIGGMCIKCGQKTEDESGVAFRYIHKDLRLANDEVARLREKDLKNLFRHKKLCLVLDLDHTLLNSTLLSHVTTEEEALQDVFKGSLFRLDHIRMLTKLRPFVHTFLKEASNLFEMYICTMGERPYALEMANLLDPGKIYFESRIIAQGDCTKIHQKGLDVVLGKESVVIILDDTESVWMNHRENLILMERYHFFASSCKQFGYECRSLSELKSDESEVEGALARVLQVLKRVHAMFFNQEDGNLAERDVRQVLQTVRRDVLHGCKVVFSKIFPTEFPAEKHRLWRMAEELGATCTTEIDLSVTHVISTDVGTQKSRWAVQQNKFLVHPRWLEATNYLWSRQSEDEFPVKESKKT